ncbi:hypothetical protein ACWD6I_07320 [Streptomyces sp. NPDC002454]
MITFAVTGHMDLSDDTVPLVRAALWDLLAARAGGDLIGISCIARGADSVFAEAVLAAGGRLVVVIPSQDYRQTKVKPDPVGCFDRLVEAADEVHVLPHETATRQAYESANQTLLARADRLVAVWDGVPSTGRGGTADTVALAQESGLPVDRVRPTGAARIR